MQNVVTSELSVVFHTHFHFRNSCLFHVACSSTTSKLPKNSSLCSIEWAVKMSFFCGPVTAPNGDQKDEAPFRKQTQKKTNKKKESTKVGVRKTASSLQV